MEELRVGLVGVLTIAALGVLAVLFILGLLVPWFIYRIHEQMKKTNELLSTLVHLTGSIAAGQVPQRTGDDIIELTDEERPEAG